MEINLQTELVDLSFMDLTEIPEQIFQLSKLKRLEITDNNISDIPECFFNLSNLEYLDFSRNKIHQIPSSISKLSNLKVLKISGNLLESIPLDLFSNIELTQLNFSDNQINSIPSEIIKLSNIEYLNFSNNELEEIQSSILHFSKLNSLNISGNKIKFIPNEIHKLQWLLNLNLSNNFINEINENLFQLVNLTSLYLSDNYITDISKSFSRLVELKYIDLSNNKISKLPEEIKFLTKIEKLKLQRNHFQGVPDEIFESEPKNIISFICDLQNSTVTRPLNEAKIVLVGSGGVGKTSIIRKISGLEFNIDENQTDGIKIHRVLRNINEINYSINIWDFGGQEIMHATHKFFMTHRTLYILVTTPRTEDTYSNNDLLYWIKLIESYAGNSPILIVINKSDLSKFDIGKGELMDKFHQIIGFVETSCLTGDGIEDLNGIVNQSILKLPHINDKLPSFYFDIKDELESINKDFIHFYQFRDICKKVNKEINVKSMDTILHLLHDLGIVLNYSEKRKLEDTFVLNPVWLSNGVYKLINSDLVKRGKGIVNINEVFDILSKEYPTKKEHYFILDLMEEFELSYSLPDIKDTYFIPGSFSKDMPSNFDWSWADVLKFQYTYDVLPSSVISKLIVKLNSIIYNNIVWRYGLIVFHKFENNYIYIKTDNFEKTLNIEIGGSGNKRSSLNFIRTEMEFIHNNLSKLIVKEYLPLPNNILINYKDLLVYEEVGEEYIFIPEIKQKLKIKELLDGVRTQLNKQNLKNLIANGKIDDVLNYLFSQYKSNNEIIIQVSRFSDLNKQIRLGHVENIENEKTRLIYGINDLIDEM